MENLKEFLAANNISQEAWEKADIDWGVLRDIAKDYEVFRESLVDTASFQASLIQKIEPVHSVRWRVKDVAHLLKKIIRKKAEDATNKYDDISVDNYHEIVTDLVGIRALHLFKDDCFSIHNGLLQLWDPLEKVVAYIRDGDSKELNLRYEKQDMEVKNHPAGYRSIHYIFESKALRRPVISEIQVRSIFEEAWSEIDHTIRYPDFSDNELVGYFLNIFNRLAGNADEMGSFVKDLAKSIQESDVALEVKEKENNAILEKMELVVAELSQERQKSESFENNVHELKEDIEKLKKQVSVERATSIKRVMRTFDSAKSQHVIDTSVHDGVEKRIKKFNELVKIYKKD